MEDIHDVVVVDYESFHRSSSVEVAEVVARLNAELVHDKTPYIPVSYTHLDVYKRQVQWPRRPWRRG